jgi:hypothetical protein
MSFLISFMLATCPTYLVLRLVAFICIEENNDYPAGTARRNWQPDNNMSLKERVYEGVHWPNLAQDRDWCRAAVVTAMGSI